MKNYVSILFSLFLSFNLAYSQSSEQEIKDIILGGYIDKLKDLDETALIDYNGGYLFMEVTILDKKYRFLVDTGASVTILSDEINTLSKEVGTITITDLQGNDAEKKVFQSDFLINNTEFKQIAYIKQNLNNLNLNTCWKIDGIIGANLLKICNWKISFRNNKIYFSKTAFISNDENNVSQLKWHNDVSPLIRLKYKEKYFVVALDTGFSGMLKLSNNVFEDVFNNFKGVVENGKGAGLFTINATISGKFKKVLLSEIEVGSNKLNNVQTLVDNSKPLLGNKFFGGDDVIFNFIENKVYFGAAMDATRIDSDLGLCRNDIDESKLQICFIWEKNSTKHLKIGDIVVRINDIDVSKLTYQSYCDIQNYLKQNKNVEILVDRNGKIISSIINQ